jgi:hypothetical protein
MTVSNKQISIAIIVAFFAGILGYFLFWFGYVEIFINHAEVEKFQVISREKTYECTENPCRIKVRASSKFFAKVSHPLAENKNISIAKIPLWKTEKIVIPAKKELAEVKVEKISRQNLSSDSRYDLDFFGPILTAENGEFVIFSRDFDGKLGVFIKNKASEQLLTTIDDEFLPIFLEKNFSLTENGIVIPAKNRVYYYDFATQRKFKILEINSLRIANISVSADGKEVIFYNLKEKEWQKLFTSGEIKSLGNQFFAGFWNDDFLEIRGNFLYLNDEKSRKIPLNILASDKIYLRGNNLIVEQDFEIWKIEL